MSVYREKAEVENYPAPASHYPWYKKVAPWAVFWVLIATCNALNFATSHNWLWTLAIGSNLLLAGIRQQEFNRTRNR